MRGMRRPDSARSIAGLRGERATASRPAPPCLRVDRRRRSDHERRPDPERRPDHGRGGGRDSPFGRWKAPSHDNPFGERPRRRAPRDPFARGDAGDARAGSRSGHPRRGRQRPLRLDVRLEIAAEGAVAHVPELPGCTFRAGSAVQVLRVARERVVEYARWCLEEGLRDLSPAVAAVIERVERGAVSEFEILEAERRDGAPVWLSGQPACLFRCDYESLTDEVVRQHARFMRTVARRVRMRVASLTPAQRAWKPAPDRRSIDETLRHLLAMIDWFDSRLDDRVPLPAAIPQDGMLVSTGTEPGDEPERAGGLDLDDEPALRLAERVDAAERFLLAIPASERRTVHWPRHVTGIDPAERWTHGKVCRRQAEHLREHLVGLPRAIRAAAEA